MKGNEMITTSRIVSHQEAGEALPPMGEASQVEMFERTLNLTDMPVRLDAAHREQVEAVTSLCLQNFFTDGDPEQTRAQELVGLPTALARVDFTIHDGEVQAFETEERPAGMGLTGLILDKLGVPFGQTVMDHFGTTFGDQPLVLAAPDRFHNTDDRLLLDVDVLHPEGAEGRPVLVRAEPHETADPAFDAVISRSVSTVRSEGRKLYVASSGLGEVITSLEDLPEPDESFVLKAMQTSKCNGVFVYLAAGEHREAHGKKGTVSYSRSQRHAQELLESDGIAMLEPLKPPIRVDTGEGTTGNMILRVFVTIDIDQTARAIGGCYMVRPELLVHGAANSVTGPVIVEGNE
jgi:hypothetical protein